MSLRQAYTEHANARQCSGAAKKMQAASSGLVRDIDIIRQRVSAKGLGGVFSAMTAGMLKGTWSRDTNTLSYTVARDEVEIDSINYTTTLAYVRASHRDWMLIECKSAATQEIEKHSLPRARAQIAESMMARHGNALRDHDAYRALHAVCADPAVDMRVELIVAATDNESARARFKEDRDFFIDITGKVTATPRLQVRIYLDQPYSASSEAALGAKTAPAVCQAKQTL